MSRLNGFLALLCAVALLNGVSGEELSHAEAVVEARNNDAPAELPQLESDKVLDDSLPAKSDLSESPAIIPVEIDDKNDEEQSKPAGEESMKDEENVVADAEDSKKESLELAMNADILKQPEMARLARHMKSFHNYQVYRAQKANGVRRSANDIDVMGEDDGIVPEERAIRRRKRVYKRKANNNVRHVHRRKNVANRQNSARRQNQRLQSVRRENSKNSAAKRRRANNGDSYRRGSSSKKTRSGSKRRSTSKNSSRKTKRKSSLKKRSKNDNNRNRKHAAYEEDEEPAQIQAVSAPQMIVIVDGDRAETAYVAQAA